MAFYGSIGRLFETIGCYVTTTSKGHNSKHQSGVTKLSQNKNKIKKQQSQRGVNNVEEEGNIGGSGGSTTGTRKGKKSRKKQKQKFQEDEDEYDDEY
eukprot:UN08403